MGRVTSLCSKVRWFFFQECSPQLDHLRRVFRGRGSILLWTVPFHTNSSITGHCLHTMYYSGQLYHWATCSNQLNHAGPYALISSISDLLALARLNHKLHDLATFTTGLHYMVIPITGLNALASYITGRYSWASSLTGLHGLARSSTGLQSQASPIIGVCALASSITGLHYLASSITGVHSQASYLTDQTALATAITGLHALASQDHHHKCQRLNG